MTIIKTQFLLLSSILKTRLDEVYPNVFIALRVMLRCPNTVASGEMSFTKLKLIKTFNRSHMTVLQPLRWCCVDCVIHHERHVHEEQKYVCVERTSNN